MTTQLELPTQAVKTAAVTRDNGLTKPLEEIEETQKQSDEFLAALLRKRDARLATSLAWAA